MKKFKELREEVAANSIGGGHIAGTAEAGDSPPVKKKPKVLRRKFAQCEVFVVNSDTYHKCSRRPKLKTERYHSLVGSDEVGQAIRQYARDFPGTGIMIENEKTGHMTWLRIPKNGPKF